MRHLHQKMKKNKLIIEYEFDFELFGMSTAAKGYKLAWEINRVLGIHFVKKDDLRVGVKKIRKLIFYIMHLKRVSID
jgi:hypothetical protein